MKIQLKRHHGIIYEKLGKLYRLYADYHLDVKLRQPIRIDIGPYVTLTPNGVLTIRAGYLWDGPSGPTIDTENFMRGSLIHDAFYQALRLGVLTAWWEHEYLRKFADQWIYYICLQDGMSKFRASYVYRALRMFGARHAKRGKEWRGKT